MNQLTAGLIVVIGVLGGFYVGAKYGQGHPLPTTPAAATSAGPGTGAGARAAGGGLGGAAAGGQGLAANGPIVAVSGTTITVHDRQTDKDVKVDVASARISKTTQGTTADLTQNQTVTVLGQAGADGTVTAQAITIGGGAGFGGGRQGRPSPTPST